MLKSLKAALAALILAIPALLPAAVLNNLVLNDTGAKIIKVDGSMADWPANALSFVLDKKENVSNGNQLWTSPDFLSGTLYVTYDSRYVYVAAKVTTGAPLQNDWKGAETYKGDSIEFFFSFDGRQPGHEGYFDQDLQFGFPARAVPGYVWCYTRNEAISGALCATKKTADGYILEGAIPLKYFSGARVQPGQPFLIDGGINAIGVPGAKERTVQLSISGNPDSYRTAAKWSVGKLAGKANFIVPETVSEEPELGAFGRKASSVGNLGGAVTDEQGKPLAGAIIATWPRTKEVVTDASGRFKLAGIKFWPDSTVTARKKGWYSSLAKANNGGSATIRLQRVPDYANQVPSYLFGHNFWMWMPKWGNPIKGTEPLVKKMRLRILRFGGHNNETDDETARNVGLDAFVAYCRSIGAEPYVQVSVLRHDTPKGKVLATPAWSAELVRIANKVKHYNIKYWSVGNEGDLYEPMKDMVPFDAMMNARAVREHLTAMKLVDPSILVAGGELSWKYEVGANDWVRPIVAFNRDTLNFMAIHTYGFAKEEDQTIENVTKKSDDFTTLYTRVKAKVDRSTDTTIPLIVTEHNIGATGEPDHDQGEAGALSFWCAYWMSNLYGQGIKLRIPMIMPWSLKEDWTLGAIDKEGPKAHYWGVEMPSANLLDVPVDDAVSGNPNLRFYATKSSRDGSLAMLVLNPTKAMQPATHKVAGKIITHTYYPESVNITTFKDSKKNVLVYTRPMADIRKEPSWNPSPAEAVYIKLPTPTPLGPATLELIDDFENLQMSTPKGQAWWAGCDSAGLGTIMKPMPFSMSPGGSPKSPKGCIHISGVLGANKAPYPYVTANVNTSPQSQPSDLSAFKGIQFAVKGDGGKYRVEIERAAVTDYAHFAYSFSAPKDWTTVRVPWEKFSQPGWGKAITPGVKDVMKISFHPKTNEKPFDLYIDDLNYWK